MSIHHDPPYEWDLDKARANIQTHGIDFVEAASALEDPLGLTREDPDSKDEQRFATLGMTSKGMIVVVIWTHRGERVRLISAWKAGARQRDAYGKNPS